MIINELMNHSIKCGNQLVLCHPKFCEVCIIYEQSHVRLIGSKFLWSRFMLIMKEIIAVFMAVVRLFTGHIVLELSMFTIRNQLDKQ